MFTKVEKYYVNKWNLREKQAYFQTKLIKFINIVTKMQKNLDTGALSSHRFIFKI